jgi:DNA polymerase-3 subunit gamma/tau
MLSVKKDDAPPPPLKSVSINALANQSASTGAAPNSEKSNLPADQGIDANWKSPFTDEQLKKAWVDYASSIQSQNPYLHTILINNLPKAEGNDLVLGLANGMQEAELAKEKAAIFTFLKKKLQNAQLTLTVQMIEETNIVAKAYTTTDKFKAMMEHNPSLAELKRLFDLDIE